MSILYTEYRILRDDVNLKLVTFQLLSSINLELADVSELYGDVRLRLHPSSSELSRFRV